MARPACGVTRRTASGSATQLAVERDAPPIFLFPIGATRYKGYLNFIPPEVGSLFFFPQPTSGRRPHIIAVEDWQFTQIPGLDFLRSPELIARMGTAVRRPTDKADSMTGTVLTYLAG